MFSSSPRLNQQASSYEERWTRMAPIREGLSFVLEVFADLSTDARHREQTAAGRNTGEL
jgi:hypothetical protein